MNEFNRDAEARSFNGDINDPQGEDGNDESNNIDINLSFREETHLGFHAHPTIKPNRNAIHIGPITTIMSIQTPITKKCFKSEKL